MQPYRPPEDSWQPPGSAANGGYPPPPAPPAGYGSAPPPGVGHQGGGYQGGGYQGGGYQPGGGYPAGPAQPPGTGYPGTGQTPGGYYGAAPPGYDPPPPGHGGYAPTPHADGGYGPAQPGYGGYGPGQADQPPPYLLTSPEAADAVQAKGRRDIIFGAIWLVVGLAITLFTLPRFGGYVFVAWGPALYGIYKIITGAVTLARGR